jgi:acetyl-CoA C-acetyltransferase
MGVAIVGVGIHPFGRFEGVTGLDLGAYAVRQAVRDAGVEWPDVQFAFGGSLAGLLPGSDESVQADQLVNLLGLTGIPFTNVHNGCATAGSAIAMGAALIESGQCDLGVCVGFDRHERGHFNATPEQSGLPHWYGDLGFMITTQFFAMKINRYMHDYGSATTRWPRSRPRTIATAD